jgi:hypothetical protein
MSIPGTVAGPAPRKVEERPALEKGSTDMPSHLLVRRALVAVTTAVSTLSLVLAPVAGAVGGGAISGEVFQDINRNRVRDVGEAGWQGHQLYLLDGQGGYVANTSSDAAGHYVFAGLSDGDYRVQYAAPSWWEIRDSWVPTTTNSVRPAVSLHLTGSATANFGWRQIVRSRDLNAPISTYIGPSGLRVESFNDVVTAKEVHDAVTLGLVGVEARYVTIRFDYSSIASTVAAWQGAPGSFSGYNAVCYDDYISWLDGGDQGVSHEYGHAWSLYYDTVVQQDGVLSSYLRARGLADDPRVNTSYDWSAREMVAEDYRQLLGSVNARTATQLNRDIPPAADVPGLRDFLAGTFTQPPASSTPPSSTPPPSPELIVSAPVVTPTPVVKSGTISSSISEPADVTIEIRDARGATVRRLLASVPRPAGAVSAVWDKKDSSGRRVRSGTYAAVVKGATADGRSDSASTDFKVS